MESTGDGMVPRQLWAKPQMQAGIFALTESHGRKWCNEAQHRVKLDKVGVVSRNKKGWVLKRLEVSLQVVPRCHEPQRQQVTLRNRRER